MKLIVPTTAGFLAEKFAKKATGTDSLEGFSIRSFPITISDVPVGTKSLALTFIDYDAVPVSGFPWIHWIACNIDAKTTEIPEHASRQHKELLTQGINSAFRSADNKSIINGYVGPAPPDKDHEYTLKVYALDKVCDLSEGFFLNELMKEMRGHILAEAELFLLGKC